ncbi:Uncharacterised protein [Mycobacteroides abscessus subsp. abscessus]|nr:Uncharacterised protein [Mycobacteroides abscessus subsp. abscessus]
MVQTQVGIGKQPLCRLPPDLIDERREGHPLRAEPPLQCLRVYAEM